MPSDSVQQQPPAAPNILINEILGFSPHLLLDDIINIANVATGQAVEAMEKQLERWAEERSKTTSDDWDSTQEIEQGIVAFQTLLEFHTDVAFDFFETWSLRNIFTFPADLPVVTPHHTGLDLDMALEREAELLAEIEDLRRKIDNQRRLKRLAERAMRITSLQAKHAQQRLARITALRLSHTDALRESPAELAALFEVAAALPEIDSDRLEPPVPAAGKRPWETGKAGYVSWVTQRLISQAKKSSGTGQSIEDIGGPSNLALKKQDRNVPYDAQGEDLEGALDSL